MQLQNAYLYVQKFGNITRWSFRAAFRQICRQKIQSFVEYEFNKN